MQFFCRSKFTHYEIGRSTPRPARHEYLFLTLLYMDVLYLTVHVQFENTQYIYILGNLKQASSICLLALLLAMRTW